MNSILSDNYYVHFQDTAYAELNTYLKKSNHTKIFVLVDENTNEHCYPIFIQQLETEVDIEIIEIESGEVNKNLETCLQLWNVLTELGADRKSLLINVGGGVITDMGGFVASAFKRGISFINVPTTLLSMVDASVGGKTGVDLGVLKNQIGFFSNPEMVLIDVRFLTTVTEREIKSGVAEIIKYGLTYDKSLWNEIKSFKTLEANSISKIIKRSIEIKNEVVLEDPKENGLRKILNFGHTLGHAIESYFLESENKTNLTHGEAIAVGMVTESYISHKLLGFSLNLVDEIKNIVTTIYGKIDIENSDYSSILELLIHDKKNTNGEVNFVLLEELEKFKINCKVEENLLLESLDYYRS